MIRIAEAFHEEEIVATATDVFGDISAIRKVLFPPAGCEPSDSGSHLRNNEPKNRTSSIEALYSPVPNDVRCRGVIRVRSVNSDSVKYRVLIFTSLQLRA